MPRPRTKIIATANKAAIIFMNMPSHQPHAIRRKNGNQPIFLFGPARTHEKYIEIA